MSCRLFIHDFFQDGRLDALAEVHILQHVGLWTKERRKRLTKEAVSTNARLKHDSPHMREATAYYAGRLAGLKSHITARFSEVEDEEQLLPLPVPQRETKEDVSALEQTVIPLAYLTGVDLYNVMFPVSHESMIIELVFIALVCWQRQNIARFLLFLDDLMEGKHELL